MHKRIKCKLTVLWKSSIVNSVKPSLTRSCLLFDETALNLKRHKNFIDWQEGEAVLIH